MQVDYSVLQMTATQYEAAMRAFRQHVIDAYPHEAVGYLDQAGAYHRLASAGLDFALCDPNMGTWSALLHSHIIGPNHPTATDMQGQLLMGKPWGLVTTDGESVSDVLWWGDMFTPPPLLGRQYRPGPSGSDGRGDCYAFIRDAYLFHSTHQLPEVVRDVGQAWTEKRSLYLEHYQQASMTLQHYDPALLEVGDVLVMSCGHGVAGHAGVYLGREMIAHHWYQATSRLDPIHRYRHTIQWMLKPPKGTLFNTEGLLP